jgi:hypothetical protein
MSTVALPGSWFRETAVTSSQGGIGPGPWDEEDGTSADEPVSEWD